MKGCRVDELKRLSVSPMVKINVIAMINASNAFPQADHMMAFGKVIDASWISSAVINETRLVFV